MVLVLLKKTLKTSPAIFLCFQMGELFPVEQWPGQMSMTQGTGWHLHSSRRSILEEGRCKIKARTKSKVMREKTDLYGKGKVMTRRRTGVRCCGRAAVVDENRYSGAGKRVLR